MTTYEQFIEKAASEKIVLCWIEPAYRLQGWAVHTVGVYKINPPSFVVRLFVDGVQSAEVFTIPVSDNNFFYDKTANTIYLKTSSNPDSLKVRADFRLFFSNGPFNLPFDLASGEVVEYEPLLKSTSQFGYEFDSEQLGIALEGQGSVILENNHGFFDPIWDKYFWENKPCFIYSWSQEIAVTEAKLIYKGFINSKSFSTDSVTFRLTDFISKLQDNVPLDQFSLSDGVIPTNVIGKFKRRIYGRLDGLRMTSLDQTLDGFTLTGTVVGQVESKTISGVSTIFLSELSPEDDLVFDDERYKVESITSDTSLTVSRALETGLSGTIKVRPKIPYRRKNRTWSIAGHRLKRIKATITSIVSENRFLVDTIQDIGAGDIVVINGILSTVKRSSGNLIVLKANLTPVPSIGDFFYRYPVQGVNAGTTDFLVLRDFVLDNTTEAILEMDELAEFNVTEEFPFFGTATFTNGSRVVTGTNTSFDTDFIPRDWIKLNNSVFWYEVLQVNSPTELEIRTPFAQATQTAIGFKKNVTYLDEKSPLTVNCLGKTFDGTEDGQWIKTTGDVIKDILNEQGLSAIIDIPSFDVANVYSPELVSLKIPLEIGSANPVKAVDVINKMTATGLGALYSNNSFEISYSTIIPRKPPGMIIVEDQDILGFEVINKSQDISREVIVLYRHQDSNRFTLEESALSFTTLNDVVDLFMDTKKSKEIDLYLYNSDEVGVLAKRYGLIYETGSTRIILSTKLNLSRKNIGDQIYLKLDRLYKRFGSDGSRRKISSITGITKDGNNTVVTIDDFGNLFTKVATYCEDGSSTFDNANDDEKARNGYFTFDSTELSDQTLTYRINLFG